MQKEIHEQPRAVSDTIVGVVDGGIDVDGLFGAGATAAFRESREAYGDLEGRRLAYRFAIS